MLPHLCFMLRHTSVCTSVTCNLFSLAGGFFFPSFFLSVLTPDLFYIQSPLQLQWWWAVPWLIKYSGEVAMAAAWSWEGIQIVTSRCHTHWHRECLKSPDQTQGTPQAHNLCPPALNGVNNTQKGTVPLGPRLWREFNNHQSTQVCMPHPCNYHVRSPYRHHLRHQHATTAVPHFNSINVNKDEKDRCRVLYCLPGVESWCTTDGKVEERVGWGRISKPTAFPFRLRTGRVCI